MGVAELEKVLGERGVDAERVLREIAAALEPTPSGEDSALLADGGIDVDRVSPAEVAGVYASAAAFDALFLAASLTSAEVASLLGIRAESVRNHAANAGVISFKHGQSLRYPDFQFRDGRRMPHTADVVRSAPDFWSTAELAGFLTTPQPGLMVGKEPAAPIDWLFAGRPVAQVLAEMDWDF